MDAELKELLEKILYAIVDLETTTANVLDQLKKINRRIEDNI